MATASSTSGSEYQVYYGTTEKAAVVIDMGTAYTKVGFAGEYAPRHIIPTKVSSAFLIGVCTALAANARTYSALGSL